MRPARLLFATAMLSLSAGCDTPPAQVSLWTPPDFVVEVSQTAVDADGVPRTARRFEVRADGIAVYGEASRDFDTADGPVPLFDTVCIYELHPNSVRMLGRLLQRAGVFDAGGSSPEGRVPISGDIAIGWSAFGDHGVVASWSEDPVVFDRLLQVVNAFVPPGCGFGAPRGEKEPRHVAEVPAPVKSVRGAMEAFRHLRELRPDDTELQRELLVLEEAVGTGA